MPRKNAAASALGKLAWKGTTARERREKMAELGRRRMAKLSKKQRSALGVLASEARAAKRAAPPKPKGKR